MPDSKNINWADTFGMESGVEPKAKDSAVDAKQPAANDADGWQQYRRWITKAPNPRGRRSGLDPALYSWKGYRDWSDQIKRSWIKDADSDD